MIRVLLADDSDLFRSALRTFLRSQPDIELVGDAASIPETVALAARLKPDVVLLDLHMPDRAGIVPAYVKTHLLISAEHILTVSVWNDEESKALSDSYGAAELLDKASLGQQLVPTLRRLSQNSRQVSTHTTDVQPGSIAASEFDSRR